jgi:hypothetical protein
MAEEIENKNTVSGLSLILEEWKVVIETQMHFNQMLMQMRTAAISIALAVFGAAAYSLQYNKLFLTLGTYHFHAAVIIMLFGLGMLVSVSCLDYFYYFKMLLGAVKRGYQIDEAFKNKIDGYKVFGMTTMIRDSVGDPVGKTRRSAMLIWAFYGIMLALGVAFIICILLGYAPTLSTT